MNRQRLVTYWFLALDASLPVVEAVDAALQEYHVDFLALQGCLRQVCQENESWQTSTAKYGTSVLTAIPQAWIRFLAVNLEINTWLLLEACFPNHQLFGFCKTSPGPWLPMVGFDQRFNSTFHHPIGAPMCTLQVVIDGLKRYCAAQY